VAPVGPNGAERSAEALVPDPDAFTVALSPMRRRHLRSVLRIESRAVPKGWSLGLFMSELARGDDRVYLVAKVDGAVVGVAGMLYAGDDGHVTTVSVDEAWRGCRIGTRMVVALARAAREWGAEALTLEVRASNQAAIALYRRLGFAPAGIRRNYYREIDEDALVMWASGIQEPGYARRLDAVEAGLPSPTRIEGVPGATSADGSATEAAS
jgi:ribosomal-protein-alanine N-acetyltransferase